MDPDIITWVNWWLPTIMGVPTAVTSPPAPPVDPTLQSAYDTALNLALPELALVPSQPTSPSVYAIAVYNLAGDVLCETAQDEPPSTYWTDLRNKLGLNNFTPGIISSASDQGTSESMTISDQVKEMTLFDLQLAKTPWGRRYLAIAGEWGAVWGLTY